MKCHILEFIDSEKKAFDVHYKELNISELCRCVDITRAGFYKIINGDASPRIDTCLKIRNYLNENVFFGEYSVEDLWTLD